MVVPVRLSAGEQKRLDAARTPKGLSRSAYIRMTLLEKLWEEEELRRIKFEGLRGPRE
jgi:hypothetical protein